MHNKAIFDEFRGEEFWKLFYLGEWGQMTHLKERCTWGGLGIVGNYKN